MSFKQFRGDSAQQNLQGHYFKGDSGFVIGGSHTIVATLQSIEWQEGGQVFATEQAIHWLVFGNISVNAPLQPLQWNTFQSVLKTLNSLQWKTFNPVSETFTAIKWPIGGHTSGTKTIQWDMGGHLPFTPFFYVDWVTGGRVVSNLRPIQWGVNGGFSMAFGLQAYKYNRLRIPNNVNYQNYRLITVQNNDAGMMVAGTTVDMVFNHAAMVTAGECNEMGDDLRITWCPSYAAEQEIDAEILNPNTSSAILRFSLMAGIPEASSVTNYRMYTGVISPTLFEETFRNKAGVYYFYANQLSSQLALTHGTFSNEIQAIVRMDDTNEARIGFNIPDNADVEVDFRFLDNGSTEFNFLGIAYKGDVNASDSLFAVNNYDDGSKSNVIHDWFLSNIGWSAFSTPVANARNATHTLRMTNVGNSFTAYLDGTVLSTFTDTRTPVGGMVIRIPAGISVEIFAIRVRNYVPTTPTVSLGSAFNNLVDVKTSTGMVFDQTTKRNIQSTVLRIKRFPDGHFLLEDARPISEWGDSYPATVGQTNGSFEVHLFHLPNTNPAAIIEGMTT